MQARQALFAVYVALLRQTFCIDVPHAVLLVACPSVSQAPLYQKMPCVASLLITACRALRAQDAMAD